MNDPMGDFLSEPLGFTSFGDILFSEDHILLVPDAETAAESEIAVKVVNTMLKFGADAGQLAILVAESEERPVAESLIDFVSKGLRIVVHRPELRGSLALLGVDAEDRPIALNRELVDADMIVTLGRYYPAKNRQRDHFGLHTAIYPRFADRETIRRFAETSGAGRRLLRGEVEEVARQLGVLFTVQWLRRRARPDFIVSGLPEQVAAELEKQSES